MVRTSARVVGALARAVVRWSHHAERVRTHRLPRRGLL